MATANQSSSAAKRGRPLDDSEEEQPETVLTDETKDALEKNIKDWMADLLVQREAAEAQRRAAADQSLLASFSDTLGKKLRALTTANEVRFSGIENKSKELEARVARLEEARRESHSQLDALSAQVDKDLRHHRAADPLAEMAWDRDPDLTIVRVRAREPVARTAVAPVIARLVAQAELPSDGYELTGDAISKQFVVRFAGTVGAATRRAQRLLGALRGKNGQWQEVFSEGLGNDRVQLYLAADENRKAERTRILCKRARDAVAKLFPDERFFVDRARGTVSSRWVPLFRISPAADGPTLVEWCDAGLVKLKLDRSQLEPAVLEAVKPPEEFKFCL